MKWPCVDCYSLNLAKELCVPLRALQFKVYHYKNKKFASHEIV